MNALTGLHRVLLWTRLLAVLAAAALLVPSLAAAQLPGNPEDAPADASVILPAVVADRFTGDLDEIRQRGVLRALVTVSRTDFFLQGGRPLGIHVELLENYEKKLNKGLKRGALRTTVKYVPVTFDRLIPALLAGEGDIALANLTITPEREGMVNFVRGREASVNELLVVNKAVTGIAQVEDLAGRTVHVLRGSSYQTHLKTLSDRLVRAGKPAIKIREAHPKLMTEDLLELVNAGVIEMTVADDYRARLWAKVLPDLVVGEDIKIHEQGTLGWAVRKDNPQLLASLKTAAKGLRRGTLVGNMLAKRYYKNTKWIKNPISERERQKLARVIDLFIKYGEQYGFDWIAIAAQAYQESGLDHSVRSPAGAVGIMQILPTTARDANVGIPDIEKIENNIHAGTRYMAFLRDRYFSEPGLDEENRVAFTWAAYNAGPAKVKRMRARAKKMGLDPNQWFGNVEYAALATVGQETVRYVSNIFKYYVTYKLLTQLERDRKHQLETLKTSGR